MIGLSPAKVTLAEIENLKKVCSDLWLSFPSNREQDLEQTFVTWRLRNGVDSASAPAT
jgi:hypothetical protein